MVFIHVIKTLDFTKWKYIIKVAGLCSHNCKLKTIHTARRACIQVNQTYVFLIKQKACVIRKVNAWEQYSNYIFPYPKMIQYYFFYYIVNKNTECSKFLFGISSLCSYSLVGLNLIFFYIRKRMIIITVQKLYTFLNSILCWSKHNHAEKAYVVHIIECQVVTGVCLYYIY